MRFIDLFSGLGGFHLALNSLGHQCVFASEINVLLSNLYTDNFGIAPAGDITKIDPIEIPEHEILCAGFPCQPFSKAGLQKGIADYRGQLIDYIVEILRVHKTPFFILENVRNLERHNDGQTWEYIRESLEILGYSIDKRIISPHQIGIPQHRERIFVVGALNGLNHFRWFDIEQNNSCSVYDVIENTVDYSNEFNIEIEKLKVLNVWQNFLDSLPEEVEPYSPLWTMEFGATYPYQDLNIHELSVEELCKYKGKFGEPLVGKTKDEIFSKLPNYIKTQKGVIPKWKQNFIKNNRDFYCKNSKFIDKILPEIIQLGAESWQKFEWNCKGKDKNIWNYLIQFRGSGIRIKKTDYFPSLVTVRTQMPIVGWKKRYVLPIEGARIQSLPDTFILPQETSACFKALGNSVNTQIVKLIAESLIVE